MLNSNSVYTFQNAGSGKMLNLYGSASDGKNVVQYDADGSDEQRWKYTGNKLLTMRNTNFALDRYRGSGSYNNADVWTESSSNDDDQKVFIQVNSNTHTCRIILLSTLDTANQLCLTAYGSGNGTASGKSSTSNGNVFWAAPTYDDYQNWYYTEEGSSSEPTSTMPKKQYLVSPFCCTAMTADFDTDCEMIAAAKNGIKCNGYRFSVHHGIDLIGSSSLTSVSSTYNIMSSGFGEVVDIRQFATDELAYSKNPGNTVMVKYPNAAFGNGNSCRDVYFLYCHLKCNSINVSVGDIVTPNTMIAMEGATGKGAQDGRHLHLEAFSEAISKSPSEGGSTSTLLDPTIFLFNKLSSEDSYQYGTRKLIVDNDAPYNRAAYCDSCSSHNGQKLYYYNIAKVHSRGSFVMPTFN